MNNALEIYKSLSQPPTEALKQITGGRLAGMTDIKPQWRIFALTQQFGLCGIGWKYTVDKQWTEPGANGEVFAFVNISLFIKDEDKWSEAIPGTGGSMLIAKEKNGLYCSDEAFKMATTDALSVACKFIGVAANIYMGHGSGKYDRPAPKPESPKKDLAGTLQDEFSGEDVSDKLKPGQEVPTEFWKISKDRRHLYIPEGYITKKNETDNKYYVIKKEAR
jgi:hypothetical protein